MLWLQLRAGNAFWKYKYFLPSCEEEQNFHMAGNHRCVNPQAEARRKGTSVSSSPVLAFKGSLLHKIKAGWSDSCVYLRGTRSLSLLSHEVHRYQRSRVLVFVSSCVLAGHKNTNNPSRDSMLKPLSDEFLEFQC